MKGSTMKYILIVVLMNGPVSIVAEFDNKLACETAKISVETPDAGVMPQRLDLLGVPLPLRRNRTLVSSCNPKS